MCLGFAGPMSENFRLRFPHRSRLSGIVRFAARNGHCPAEFLCPGAAASHAAHALEAAEVALADQESQAEGDDHSDEGPSQQLHA